MAIVYGKHYVSTKAATGEQVYLEFRIDNNGPSAVANWFCRVVDKDTNEVLYAQENVHPIASGSFKWIYVDILLMPERDLNLRIESGQDDIVEGTYDILVPNVPFPSNRYMLASIEDSSATQYVPAGEYIPSIYTKRFNRGTDICYGKAEFWDMNKGEVMVDPRTGHIFAPESLDPPNIRRGYRYSYMYPMPNEDLHIQIRGYHIDPATGEYLQDTFQDLFIQLLAQPEICDWIDSKGGPSSLTVPDVFVIVDSYLFSSPPPGYEFIPTLENVFGIIDYYLGFDGDAKTGCDFYP